MRIVSTEISLVSRPEDVEPEAARASLRRRVQIAPSADGRATLTFVSWLAPSADADGAR
jgi:hypothetical protein